MLLKPNITLLFQGDSVTDCGRSRNDDSYLGNGYPSLIADELSGLGCRVLNRGVSGDRVSDVLFRKEEDIFALEPDILTILVGVNDTWRRYDSGIPRSSEEFEAIYRELISEVRRRLPKTTVIIMSPFVLEVPDKAHWIKEDFADKLEAVRRIAADFADIHIPLDEIFKSEFDKHDDIYFLSPDGVHPSDDGHKLIAKCWLNAVSEA